MRHHERKARVRAVQSYDVDTLGAPFKVTLLDSVTFGTNPKTGEQTVQIPDLVGLVGAVVRARVCVARKLSGPELKFLRNAIGVRANVIAEFLDMTPQHLSRCEAGAKVMSSTSEKLFRLAAFIATFLKEPEDTFTKASEDGKLETKSAKPNELAEKFMRMFLTMKIEAVFDPEDELCFEFSRHPRAVGAPANDEDGEWSPQDKAA
jgi:transcriptional regulator with XRE-family HTH domain